MGWGVRLVSIGAVIGAIVVALAVAPPSPAAAQEDPTVPTAPDDWHDPEKGTRDGSPLDDLPPHITLVSDTGMRPDWSPDGDELLYLDRAPLGDVWVLDLAGDERRPLTRHFDHRGFTRAQYLANGDVVLCGPTSGPEPSAERPEAGRFTGTMSVLRAPFDEPPDPLGVSCWEGVATSPTSMQVAWNRSDVDYTDADLVDRVVNGVSEVWTGEVVYRDGHAALAGARPVVDRAAVSAVAVLEVQDFRPPDEGELIVTAYAHEGGEVLGVDIDTGEVRNYSNSPRYEEAESVAADGSFVLTERDLESAAIPGPLDIWWLSLDGRSSWQRLTTFNRYRGGWYASNPAVSPDGKRFAFQLSIDGPTEGQGEGLLLFDLTAVELPGELGPPMSGPAAGAGDEAAAVDDVADGDSAADSDDGNGRGRALAIALAGAGAAASFGLGLAVGRRRAR